MNDSTALTRVIKLWNEGETLRDAADAAAAKLNAALVKADFSVLELAEAVGATADAVSARTYRARRAQGLTAPRGARKLG